MFQESNPEFRANFDNNMMENFVFLVNELGIIKHAINILPTSTHTRTHKVENNSMNQYGLSLMVPYLENIHYYSVHAHAKEI